MEITIDRKKGFTLAKLFGDFNLGEEETIAEKLNPLVSEKRSCLAIEMSGLKQINSLGLGQLINLVLRSRMNESRVVLVAPSAFVTGVFNVTQLDKWFDVVGSVDEASSALARKPGASAH